MSGDQIIAAREIIKKDPSLIWYTKDYDYLDVRAVVEAVLNYGLWEQTQKLISILSVDQVAKLFIWHKSQPRTNLHPLAINYYSYYFARHAPKYSHL